MKVSKQLVRILEIFIWIIYSHPKFKAANISHTKRGKTYISPLEIFVQSVTKGKTLTASNP